MSKYKYEQGEWIAATLSLKSCGSNLKSSHLSCSKPVGIGPDDHSSPLDKDASQVSPLAPSCDLVFKSAITIVFYKKYKSLDLKKKPNLDMKQTVFKA